MNDVTPDNEEPSSPTPDEVADTPAAEVDPSRPVTDPSEEAGTVDGTEVVESATGAPPDTTETAPAVEATDPDGVSAVPVVPAPAWSTPTYAVTPPAVAAAAEVPKPKRGLTLLVGIVIGALIGGAVGGAVSYATRDEKTVVHEVSKTVEVGRQARVGQTVALGALLKRVEPAVVAIRTSDSGGGIQGDDTLPVNGGAGTGFVIKSDGVILTNYHVVQGAASIDATFTDGTRKTAKVLGTAPDNDLAVLKVDGDNLPTMKLGTSDDLEVGQNVIAIGNALALEGGLTVTTGILSGKNRNITTDDGNELRGLLQTDAAINPGNSGGPLITSDGAVIGINTATAPSQYEGIGFAIAIDSVKPLIADLESGRSIKRAYLGVASVSNSPALAKENELSVDSGAVIARVEADTPADAAGIKRGDVVVAVDGAKIENAEDLTAAVRRHRPGDKIEIELYRGDAKQTVSATLTSAPDQTG